MAKTPEAKVRDPVVKWAKEHGIGHVRMSMRPGVRRGVPDDLFLIPGKPRGWAVFIEFKRPGRAPTPIQSNRIKKLWNLSFDAGAYDNADAAIDYLRTLAGYAGAKLK